MPKDAPRGPRKSQEAASYVFSHVGETHDAESYVGFYVSERPQDTPGGRSVREFTCETSPGGEKVGGQARVCGVLVFCMVSAENV